jgi:hypothetical protein
LDQVQREERLGTKQHLEYDIFNIVRNFVSNKTLDLTYKQLVLARKKGPEGEPLDYTKCTGRYTKFMGLPCKCIIAQRLQTLPPQPLRLADFDKSWHLRTWDNEERIPILPPQKTVGKLGDRPVSSRNKGKIESGFEKAARIAAQEQARKDGVPCWSCTLCPYEKKWSHKKSMLNPQQPKHHIYQAKQKENSEKPTKNLDVLRTEILKMRALRRKMKMKKKTRKTWKTKILRVRMS